MKTEELIKELKLSIHEGINVLDPLAKELLKEYKMQQLVYAVIFGISTVALGVIIYKMAKRYIRQIEDDGYWDAEFPEFFAFALVPIGFLFSICFAITAIVNFVSPILSLMQSLTGN